MQNVNEVRQKNGRICRCGRPCYGYDYVCSLGCQEAAWKENGIEDIPGERSLRSYLIQGCGETVEIRAANADEAARQFRPGCRRLDNVSGSASFAFESESFTVKDSSRGPGRPPGTSPNGNPPGSQGNPEYRVRLTPDVHAQIAEAGGKEWARAVLLSALPRQVELYTCEACRHPQLQAQPCENCGHPHVEVETRDLAELPPNLRDLYRLENGLRIL